MEQSNIVKGPWEERPEQKPPPKPLTIGDVARGRAREQIAGISVHNLSNDDVIDLVSAQALYMLGYVVTGGIPEEEIELQQEQLDHFEGNLKVIIKKLYEERKEENSNPNDDDQKQLPGGA